MTNRSAPAPRRAHAGRIDRLKVRHLRLLELVADQGSLSAAAQALNVSQPGATKMLQELEDAFGCRLIERSTRGGQLSPAGAHALSRLRVALGALDAASQGLSEQAELPLVRLGMLPLVAVSALPAVVGAMAQAGTLARLTIREGTVEVLLAALLDGELDALIGRLDSDALTHDLARLRVVRLWEEGLGLAASPAHELVRRRRPVELEALRAHRWVLPHRGSDTRRKFDQLFLDAGVLPPPPHIESMSFHTNLALASTGELLTVAPRTALLHYQRQKAVKEISTSLAMPTAHVVSVTLRDAPPAPGFSWVEGQLLEWVERLGHAAA